ncbi:hypothetical protein ACWGID_14945 [Kribbella sp. NPDC054772]
MTGPSNKISETTSGAIGTLGIVALAAAPIAVARSRHVSLTWPLAGAASWALASIIKRAVPAITGAVPSEERADAGMPSAAPSAGRRSMLAHAAQRGAISAAAELGCTALAFAVRRPSAPGQVVAFGAGVGGIEALYVLALGIAHPADPETLNQWRTVRQHSLVVDQFVLIERSVAMTSHIASRGLLSTALHTPGRARARRIATSLALFTLADTVAAYGHLANWNWLDPRVARRTHAFYTTIATLESYLYHHWTH